MLSLILAVVLSGSGTGATVQVGRGSDPHVVGPFEVAGGLLAGNSIYKWTAARTGRFTGLIWNESTGGTGTSMTYALRVDGAAACSITVPCDISAPIEQECDVKVSRGQALSLEVVVDGCAVSNPSGALMVIAH